MKTLFTFVLGAVAGIFGYRYYEEHYATTPPASTSRAVEPPPPPPSSPTPSHSNSVMDSARSTAQSARDALSDKLSQWHLSPDDIKEEIAKTGSVVRSRARAAGESIATATASARVVAVIKAKYTLDKELSSRTIDVDYKEGKVTLRGTVAAPALVGKAVAEALDTEGVTQVVSQLTVQP